MAAALKINGSLHQEENRQEAQLPLREQGVSFVFSSHNNATHANLAHFLS